MKIRLSPDLKQQVTDAAKTNHSSINAEIVARLEMSFGPAIVAKYDAAIQQIRDLEAVLGTMGNVRLTPDPIDEQSQLNPNRNMPKADARKT